jgi:hypothetical protein
MISDALAVLYDAIKQKNPQGVLFLIKSRFSDYYSIRKTAGLLTVAESEINKILSRLDLKGKILYDLTNMRNRFSVLIQF